jgi:transposase InsO family protein
MRKYGIQPKQKQRYKVTTQSKHNLPISPNLLEQDFTASGMNEKWVADITYIRVDVSVDHRRPLFALYRRLGTRGLSQ